MFKVIISSNIKIQSKVYKKMCIIYTINIFKFLQVGKNHDEDHFSFYREHFFKNRKKLKVIKIFKY